VDHEHDPRFSVLSGRLLFAPLHAPASASPSTDTLAVVDVQADDFALGMLTAPRRLVTVDETLRQLRGAGFSQQVTLFCEPGSVVSETKDVEVHEHVSELGCLGNYLFAAKWLLNHSDAPYVLILEDDLFLCRDAALALQHGVNSVPAGFGYLSLYTPLHVVRTRSVRRGWQQFPVSSATRGALALCFSRESLQLAVAELESEPATASPHPDLLISGLFQGLGRPCFFHVPSLCAHAGNQISTLGHDGMPECDAVDYSGSAAGYVARSENQTVGRSGLADGLVALTSIPPSDAAVEKTQRCLASWRAAGLGIVSFNHPSEIPKLQKRYDVDFVAVEETAFALFGRHYVPINSMLHWAAGQGVDALLINADIELALAPWEMARIRYVSAPGLAYLVRYNHHGDRSQAQREPYGMDAFLIPKQHASKFPATFLCMGQPWWDFWIPHWFQCQRLPIYSPDFAAAYHEAHAQRWSWHEWYRCGAEVSRVAGLPRADSEPHSWGRQCMDFREELEQQTVKLHRRPDDIHSMLSRLLGDSRRKVILECGAHVGADTLLLAELPGATVHAIEPDPRNSIPARANVVEHRVAISDRDGSAPLLLSEQGWGMPWTESSSLKQPKLHLERYAVTFGESVIVETRSLNSITAELRLDTIDLIWADIQGAERELIAGGGETLARTRYLYTEYANEELYEGQLTLAEMLAMLPDFGVVELWEDNVLLENMSFRRIQRDA
jgi:FkbM family methyltransferase